MQWRGLVRIFLSKVVIAIYSRGRQRASRFVAKAMSECFTDELSNESDEAERLGHNFVGTEQILLGLISEGTGIAAKVVNARR